MNVTKIKAKVVKTYVLTIEDGEVRPLPWSRTGAQYRVESAEVAKRDGNVASVKLHGSVLKKDGTVGKNPASEQFYRQDTWPEWLRGVVGGLA